MRRLVQVTFIAVLVLGASGAAFPSTSAAGAGDCPTTEQIPSVGLACRAANGLLAVFAADGAFLGYTHGADAAAAGEPAIVAAAASVPPACIVNPTSTDYYTKVIYARPSDVADSWSTKKASIVSFVSQANGYVSEAAQRTNGAAAIKVQCDASGNVLVFNAALAHTRSGGAGDFSTVTTDLKNLGYTEINAKHWVFVDGGSSDICSCGVGNVYYDDTLSASNSNNGVTGTVAEFAVDWSWANSPAHIALHELSHNMGAVQKSAPHSSDAGHCNDGLDTMCYQDGGTKQCTSGFSCPGTCATEVYDCNNDDYFHATPPSTNYLATHWNIGNTLNRFLLFSPQVRSLTCTSPIGVTQSTTCSMQATFSTNVRYSIAWGDGATSCVPADCVSTVAPGTTQTATHTYASGGTKTVSVNATSATTPPRTGPSTTASVAVDATAPTTTLSSSSQAPGADTSAARKWYAPSYRFTLSGADSGGTGLQTTQYALDGAALATYTGAVTVTAAGPHSLVYRSSDKGGNVEANKTFLFGVDTVLPDATTPTLTPACDGVLAGCVAPVLGVVSLGGVTVRYSGSDALSGLQSLTLFATGPAGTTEPVTNAACSATLTRGTTATVTATCFYTGFMGAPGEYCFTTKAVDEAGNARTTPLATAPCAWILPG